MQYSQPFESPIGFLNVTAGAHHLYAIEPSDEPIAHQPNPHTRLTCGLLEGYFRGDRPDFSVLPFLWPKAPFYQAVLQALLRSDYGVRLSYGELARLAGRERAHRAAAAAVAQNPFAVAIACHRVVHASGGVGAYRWGRAKKAWLLHHESID